MDLDDCFRKGLIKKTNVNTELIKSLIEMSKIKELAVSSAKIDKINISAYVSLAYDALREILEAICISRGYKVLSHICIGELLKDVLDRLRWTRNSINYYGIKVDFEQGKEIIDKIFVMKNKFLKEHLSAFKS